MIYDLRGKRIWIAGHTGMVGSALVRQLPTDATLVMADRRSLDLRHQWSTRNATRELRPDVVIVAAATVGGIGANMSRPVDFLYDNLMIAANVIRAAAAFGVEKLLFLGSSCVYPPSDKPITPGDLLSGPLEPTNEWYAIAKIAGIKLCQAYRQQHGLSFISAMPCNLYGPGDNFDAANGHVIPALIRKFHDAKMANRRQVTVWGSGSALREFMHVDDCASALVHVLQHYDGYDPINVGTGYECTVGFLVNRVIETVGYRGAVRYDNAKPNGAARKLLDSSVLRDLGWAPHIELRRGLDETYASYLTALERGTLRTSTTTR